MGNIVKKARRRLEGRIKAFEALKNKTGYTKPGSLKYK